MFWVTLLLWFHKLLSETAVSFFKLRHVGLELFRAMLLVFYFSYMFIIHLLCESRRGLSCLRLVHEMQHQLFGELISIENGRCIVLITIVSSLITTQHDSMIV